MTKAKVCMEICFNAEVLYSCKYSKFLLYYIVIFFSKYENNTVKVENFHLEHRVLRMR